MAAHDEEQPQLTAKQIVAYVSSVIYKIAAPKVARDALLSAIQDLGLPEPRHATLVAAVLHAETEELGQEAEQATKKRKKSEDNGVAGVVPDKKKRTKRGLSAMNVFMVYVIDCFNKDQANPAFKVLAPTVDADGKVTKARGGSMQLGSQCWKALAESDKARFIEMVGPYLKSIEGVASTDRGKGQLLEEIKTYLQSHKLEREMHQLVYRAVEAATGINPKAPGMALGTPKPQSNGTATKADKAKPAPASAGKKAPPTPAPVESDSSSEEEDEDEEEEGESSDSDE